MKHVNRMEEGVVIDCQDSLHSAKNGCMAEKQKLGRVKTERKKFIITKYIKTLY